MANGMQADLVVLSDIVLELEPESRADARVDLTVGGEVAFVRDAGARE